MALPVLVGAPAAAVILANPAVATVASSLFVLNLATREAYRSAELKVLRDVQDELGAVVQQLSLLNEKFVDEIDNDKDIAQIIKERMEDLQVVLGNIDGRLVSELGEEDVGFSE